MGTEFILGVPKVCQNWVIAVTAQLCEHIQNHSIIHFRRMDFMVGDLHPNIAP